MQQWILALIAACICFGIILMFEKKDPDNIDKNDNKKYILFFFIIIMFQIIFYYLDLSSFITKMISGGAENKPIQNLSELTRQQQELLQSEFIKNINQDINVGYPPF